jgi:hypothetical protein
MGPCGDFDYPSRRDFVVSLLGEYAMNRSAIHTINLFIVLTPILLVFGCRDTEPEQQTALTGQIPLYLEEHLDAAHIVGSEVPEDALKPVEWRFDEPQPDWKPLKPIPAHVETVKPIRVEDALRLSLTAKNRYVESLESVVPNPGTRLFGAIYVELPNWNIEDWAYVEVRGRTRDPAAIIALHFNYTEDENPHGDLFPTYSLGDVSRPVADGRVQMCRLSLEKRSRDWQGPWTHLMILCVSEKDAEAVTLDILSVRIVPKEALYTDAPVGVRYEVRDEMHRRTIFTHTPGKLQYRLRTPEAGQLDVGLGVLKEDAPVDFKITAKPDRGDTVTILEETYADHKGWAQRRIDLSDFSGKLINLSLETNADRKGTIAFWAKPTVSGKSSTEGPLTSTLIWDTQSPLVAEVDLSDRINWKVVVDPIINRSETYGGGHFFKGDAVVENKHLVAVFRLGEGRVVVYSKADLSQKKVEFVPLQLKGKSTSIANYRILHNTGEDAVLEVSFTGAKAEEEVSALFFFSSKEIVEVKPSENMKGISLLSPIEYGIVPDFVADDLILDPKEYPSTNTLHIPSSNLFLGLLRGRNNMLVVTWPEGEQQMRLMLGNKQVESRLIESIDFENNGKSIYLALLDAPGIWHKEELKPSYLERDIAINWKRPFPAKWITQLHEFAGRQMTRTTYRFSGFRGRFVRYGFASYIYPVWFEGESTYYRLGKKIPPKGESLIYFLERKGTPVSVSTPVDIMKEALGRQACETIFDLPGRALRTHHRRPGVTHPEACVCGFWDNVLVPIFEKGQEVEKKELVEETVDDMAFFVTQLRKRIDEYQEFAHDMISFLNLKRKSNPDLKQFLDSMEAITEEILQEYSRLKEQMKTLAYVDELVRKTKALMQKKDQQNLPTSMDLNEKWSRIGGAQDELVVQLHRMTRNLFQEAGYGCVNHPEAIEIAEEIRRRCRECLRNPDGLETWPDY